MPSSSQRSSHSLWLSQDISVEEGHRNGFLQTYERFRSLLSFVASMTCVCAWLSVCVCVDSSYRPRMKKKGYSPISCCYCVWWWVPVLFVRFLLLASNSHPKKWGGFPFSVSKCQLFGSCNGLFVCMSVCMSTVTHFYLSSTCTRMYPFVSAASMTIRSVLLGSVLFSSFMYVCPSCPCQDFICFLLWWQAFRAGVDRAVGWGDSQWRCI